MIPCLSVECLVWGNWCTMVPGTHRSTETPALPLAHLSSLQHPPMRLLLKIIMNLSCPGS